MVWYGYNVQMGIFTKFFSFLGIWAILTIYETFYLTSFQCSFSLTTVKNFIKLCTKYIHNLYMSLIGILITCIYILVDFFPLGTIASIDNSNMQFVSGIHIKQHDFMTFYMKQGHDVKMFMHVFARNSNSIYRIWPGISSFQPRILTIFDFSTRTFHIRTWCIDGVTCIFWKFRYHYNFFFGIFLQIELTRLATIKYATETVWATLLKPLIWTICLNSNIMIYFMSIFLLLKSSQSQIYFWNRYQCNCS